MLVLIGGLIVFPFLGYWLFTVILATGGYKKPNQDKWIHSWQAKATTVTLLLAAALPVAFMAVPETWRPLWRWLAVLSLTVVFVYEAIFVVELNEGGHPGFKGAAFDIRNGGGGGGRRRRMDASEDFRN